MLAALLAMLLAAAIVGGCAGDDVDEPAELTQGGALRWLPSDTWLVATGDLSAARLDEALETLDRLPAWSFIEGELPASTGTGLRGELLRAIAEQADDDGGSKIAADDLEEAFGNRVGLAIFGDATKLDGKDAPIVMWSHVDDEQLARDAAVEIFGEQGTADEHEGVTFYEIEDRDVTYAIRDELLLATTSPDHMRTLIDVRIDGGAVADDEVAQAVIDGGIGEAVGGVAIATDPLLVQLPRLLAEQDDVVIDTDELAEALATDGVDDLVPDWVAGSITIDDVGLRLRAAWSNPREIAKPDPPARELVERMPADVGSVAASVSDGSPIERVQAAWADVVDATGIDLREQARCGQRGAQAWACRLALESALVLLEDETLAAAASDQGDTVTALAQDPVAALASLAAATGTGRNAVAQGRTNEVVTSAVDDLGWTAPQSLLRAMNDAGLIVRPQPDGVLVVRVRPASPLGRQLRGQLDPQMRALLRGYGLDPARLLGARGVRIAPDVVGNLLVYGSPSTAPSKVVPALEGTAEERLGANEDYRAVVEAADPPDEVGAWGWVAVGPLVEGVFELAGAQDPNIRRALPTVRNNLSDVPGLLTWTTRERHDGRTVGIAEAVLPILE